jgi:hypothetical protein
MLFLAQAAMNLVLFIGYMLAAVAMICSDVRALKDA